LIGVIKVKYTALMLSILIVLMVLNTGSYAASAQVFGLYDTGSIGGSPNSSGPSIDSNNGIALLDLNAETPVSSALHLSRARSLLHQNDNRSAILKFINENPGYTQRDISKLLNINLGTVRYHLMILSLNHLVTAYNDGAKRVRYFKNTSSYSVEQMNVISLLRREPTSKLIGVLIGGMGMTNAGIAHVSGLSYSDINRYLKELVSRGIVVKEYVDGKKYLYCIAPGLEGLIAGSIR
jgi:predicted transcriptional regulator